MALAYGVAWRVFAGDRWLAGGTAVFVAFVPQHLAILASVNNDALAELLIAAILFLLVARVAMQPRHWVLLGVLLGLGLLTKGTVYPVTAVIGIALLWRYWRDWRGLIQTGLWVFVPAFCWAACGGDAISFSMVG
ncbi:MAG: glycosyltransferase family 39 protein [Chloroflexota bacterium]